MLAAINKALGKHLECLNQQAKQHDLLTCINNLNEREREIIRRVASGCNILISNNFPPIPEKVGKQAADPNRIFSKVPLARYL